MRLIVRAMVVLPRSVWYHNLGNLYLCLLIEVLAVLWTYLFKHRLPSCEPVHFHHPFWSGRWEEKHRHAWRIITVCVFTCRSGPVHWHCPWSKELGGSVWPPQLFLPLQVREPPSLPCLWSHCVCVLCIDTALSLSLGIILWSVQMLQMLNNCWSGEWHSQFVGWVCTLLPVCCVHMHDSYIQVWLSGVQDSYSDWSSWEQRGYRTGSRLSHLLWPSLSRQVCIHSHTLAFWCL